MTIVSTLYVKALFNNSKSSDDKVSPLVSEKYIVR